MCRPRRSPRRGATDGCATDPLGARSSEIRSRPGPKVGDARRLGFRPAMVLVLVAVALSAWEGFQPWPSSAAHWSVAGVIGAVLVLAGMLGAHRQVLTAR